MRVVGVTCVTGEGLGNTCLPPGFKSPLVKANCQHRFRACRLSCSPAERGGPLQDQNTEQMSAEPWTGQGQKVLLRGVGQQSGGNWKPGSVRLLVGLQLGDGWNCTCPS